MRSLRRAKVNRFWLRTITRCCVVLIFFWMCRRAMTYHKVNVSSVASTCYTSTKYNITQAELGRIFFHRLIHDSEAYKDVNECTICSLIHFFFQEATHNGKHIQFSTGIFVLYDSTERFFDQLMMAKNSQLHSNEHRSGFIRRPLYFALDRVKSIFRMLLLRSSSSHTPFIYLRGDESSHFHERGNKHDRWHVYPAYGMDVMYGCMPKQFSHILFGKLKSLSNNVNHPYHGDRIYIKPEKSGLQHFDDYLAHTSHYIRAVSYSFLCRMADHLIPTFCTSEEAFHEWVDRRLMRTWTQILSTIKTLASDERRKLQDQALRDGILEMYRQTLLFPSMPIVDDFRFDLEHRYGPDVHARKGHEIIFTTEQLLHNSSTCMQSFVHENKQCV